MTTDGYVMKAKQNANQNLENHAMNKLTGKERGLGRGIINDFYNKVLAVESGMTEKQAKNYRANWDSK